MSSPDNAHFGVPVTRLPPGPEPDVPFVEQVRREPSYACACGARRRFGSDVKGRCGCIMGTLGGWTDDDIQVRRELPDDIKQQLKALSDEDLRRLRWSALLRSDRVHVLREIARRRQERAKA